MDGDGVIIQFHKKVGDQVSADEVILEVESDKATIEVSSPVNGFLKEFFVDAGKEMDVTPETELF